MKYHTILPKRKIFITLLLSLLFLVACGGTNNGNKEINEPQQKALEKIKEYAQAGINPPTVQDYITAGVTGVTTVNLDQVNSYIRTLDQEDIDTSDELEVIASNFKVNILPYVNAGVDKTVLINQPITIVGVASDNDGNIVKYEWKSGSIILANTPSFSFTPISLGTNTLTLSVTDDDGGTAFDSINLMVIAGSAINHNPVANPIMVSLNKNTNSSISLIGTDIDDDQLTYILVDKPNNGTVVLNKNTAIYTPNNSYIGNDSFSYKVNDGIVDSNIAKVSLSIISNPTNHAPKANTLTLNILKNTTKTFTLTGSDEDGDSLTFHITNNPAHGILSLNGNSVTYTANSNYEGIDSFGFRVNDGKVSSSIANVIINVKNYPQYTKSFSQAKREATEIYLPHQEAFYSGCEYYAVGKKLIPLKGTCGYQTRTNENRASRIEWEHVVSMWAMAHNFECWIKGGRSNCNGDEYRRIETDLHNLVPAIGEINGDRSNYYHGIISGEPRIYGSSVDVEVDFKKEVFEPKEDIRGDIARMYFYMQQKYGLSITSSRLQLYQSWDNCDPVDKWERERNLAIEAIQGNDNPFVTHYIYNPSSCSNDGGSSGGSSGSGSSGGSSGSGSSGGNNSCDPSKKYCSHMDSCSDAYFYLNHCGRIRLDGDKDGVPCESICK